MDAINWVSKVAPDCNLKGSSAAPRTLRGAVCLSGLLLLLLALAGCGRMQNANSTTQDAFGVTLTVEPAQPVVGDGVVVLTLRDPSGQPVDGAQLTVEANMSHAGMVPVSGKRKHRPGWHLPRPAEVEHARRLVCRRQVHPAGWADRRAAVPGERG